MERLVILLLLIVINIILFFFFTCNNPREEESTSSVSLIKSAVSHLEIILFIIRYIGRMNTFFRRRFQLDEILSDQMKDVNGGN